MLIIAVIPAVVLGGFYYQYFSGVLFLQRAAAGAAE